jgi:hypothetical protein
MLLFLGIMAPKQPFLAGFDDPVADRLDFGPFVGRVVPFQVTIFDLLANKELEGVFGNGIGLAVGRTIHMGLCSL